MRYVRAVKWTKLLPAEALKGSFQTAQAEYLYGIYQGQWVAIREGSVCEAMPDESTAGQIAALSFCQNPRAERVLVIGSGLGLCRELLRLSQIERVVWAHCDNEYVQEIERYIPSELKINDERFYRLDGDVRSMLAKEKGYYDIVILNLPDATSSVLNRYYTAEFYQQVKEALRSDGIVAVRMAGGENIMGTELINLGASTKLTLGKAFSQLVLTPGEETWFIVSDSETLTGEPDTLRERFAAIEGGTDVFPAEGLLSVYLPGRAATALENYSTADLPEDLLINRDFRPLTHLYSLLLAAKQSEAPVTKLVKHLALAGAFAFFIPILVFAGLRIAYILKTQEHGSKSSFDSTFLVFSAGWVAIGVVIVLMYLYQTQFGSLYLHIGVISSVFMVGLTIGAITIRHLLIKSSRREALLFAVVVLQTLILAIIAFWPAEEWTHAVFGAAFVLCGLCAGSYFPLAASQLASSGVEIGKAGSKLETADHLGASVGGLTTGLLLVPVLGAKTTLFVFVLLLLVNIPAAALKIYKPAQICSVATAGFRLRRLGYTLFGIGLSVVMCSTLLAAAGARLRPLLPENTAQALAGQAGLEQVVASGETGRRINYFKVYEQPEGVAGYIFSSGELAPEVRGFGGKMNLAVYVDAAGKLINFHIVRSNETPGYLKLLSQWRGELNEHQLFTGGPFSNVHAVSGATVSSEAILSALEISGHRFASQILGRSVQADVEEKVKQAGYLPDAQGIYLIGALVLVLIVIYRGGFWSRLGVLTINVVVGGIILNAQYSSEQTATLLSLQCPAVGLTGAFLLLVGVPLLVIFFGNVYCGYICPFGAAQELLGYIVPRRFKEAMPVERMQKARFIKYVVLFVLIMVFFVSRNRTTLVADPLIEIFASNKISFWLTTLFRDIFSLAAVLIIGVALIGSLFYTRFWCRYLCPVGAFLSLFNNVVILKRYVPAKKFGRCEFGLTAKDQMDCLYCDKCRYDAKAAIKREVLPHFRPAPVRLISRCFLFGVLALAVLVSGVSVSRFLEVIPAGFEQPVVSAASGGEPRDVDMQRIRTMIQQGRLSDQEAEFYKKVE
jgi:predicted membrane-bound spermidine synthase/Na+-translocating ferredoxin:NAD+ oxidoreductase RnfG subunit